MKWHAIFQMMWYRFPLKFAVALHSSGTFFCSLVPCMWWKFHSQFLGASSGLVFCSLISRVIINLPLRGMSLFLLGLLCSWVLVTVGLNVGWNVIVVARSLASLINKYVSRPVKTNFQTRFRCSLVAGCYCHPLYTYIHTGRLNLVIYLCSEMVSEIVPIWRSWTAEVGLILCWRLRWGYTYVCLRILPFWQE